MPTFTLATPAKHGAQSHYQDIVRAAALADVTSFMDMPKTSPATIEALQHKQAL